MAAATGRGGEVICMHNAASTVAIHVSSATYGLGHLSVSDMEICWLTLSIIWDMHISHARRSLQIEVAVIVLLAKRFLSHNRIGGANLNAIPKLFIVLNRAQTAQFNHLLAVSPLSPITTVLNWELGSI